MPGWEHRPCSRGEQRACPRQERIPQSARAAGEPSSPAPRCRRAGTPRQVPDVRAARWCSLRWTRPPARRANNVLTHSGAAGAIQLSPRHAAMLPTTAPARTSREPASCMPSTRHEPAICQAGRHHPSPDHMTTAGSAESRHVLLPAIVSARDQPASLNIVTNLPFSGRTRSAGACRAL